MNSESKSESEALEHLSSLMDGEVSRDTGRFLVRRLAADGDLRASWARYHLIRDCIRHQQGSLGRMDLSRRVGEALSAELTRPGARRRTAWLKPLAGGAIAASVALVAILTVSSGSAPEQPAAAAQLAAQKAPEPFVSPRLGSSPLATQPVSLSGGIRQDNQRINSYLLRHYQVSGDAGRGFVSFVPIVVTPQSALAEEQPPEEQAEDRRRSE